MMLVWVLLLAAAVGNAHGSAIEGTDGSRIVNGHLTTIDRFPSTVQVEWRFNHLWWYQVCAGVIVTPTRVISAAQCFTGFLFSLDQRRIRAGSTFRNTGGVSKYIRRALNHPNYGRHETFDSDITVLTLDSPLVFTHTISPALLPAQGFELFDHLTVTYAGWGKTRVGGGGAESEQLQTVNVYTVNHADCTARYASLNGFPSVTNNMICAGVVEYANYRDACEGDEGGPMYFNNDILVGIISWRRTCTHHWHPGVSTKVSAFSNWIHEAIV